MEREVPIREMENHQKREGEETRNQVYGLNMDKKNLKKQKPGNRGGEGKNLWRWKKDLGGGKAHKIPRGSAIQGGATKKQLGNTNRKG